MAFIKRNNLSKEPFDIEDDKSPEWMSSLERAVRIRTEVRQNKRALGDGAENVDTCWEDLVGAALKELPF